jgi:hypothetical protein
VTDVDQPASRCPVCGSKKKAAKVSGLISKGTVTTTGKIKASSVSVDTRLNVAGSSTKGTYGGVSKSELVERLSPPRKPEPGVVYVGFAAVVALIGGGLACEHVPGTFLPLIVFAVVAVPIFVVIYWLWYTDRRRAKIAAWERANQTLLDSYYCRRDDICFAPGREPLEPEEFVQAIFASPVLSAAGAAPTEDV